MKPSQEVRRKIQVMISDESIIAKVDSIRCRLIEPNRIVRKALKKIDIEPNRSFTSKKTDIESNRKLALKKSTSNRTGK